MDSWELRGHWLLGGGPIGSVPFKHSHFPLKHDDGRKHMVLTVKVLGFLRSEARHPECIVGKASFTRDGFLDLHEPRRKRESNPKQNW